MTQPQQLPSRARTTTPQHPAPQAPFDANILAGQLAPSSIAMYARDFQAYVVFAGDVATACNAATLARWRAHPVSYTHLTLPTAI